MDTETQFGQRVRAARPSCDPVAELAEFNIVKNLFPGRAPLQHIGRFTIGERLGRGGMGAVYLAEDPRLHRKVAIKLIPTRAEHLDKRLREARMLAQIDHANVVKVYEVDIIDGFVVIVMELVLGMPLRRWLERPTTVRSTVEVFVDVLDAIATIHQGGIVHGDIKPENILVTEACVVKVTDFGLAQHRVAGTGPFHGGTPAYMAPEHASTGVATEASDQFSAALCLYEALTLQRPEQGKLAFPRKIPAWLRSALRRALHVDPVKRYPSVRALRRVLTRGLGRRRTAVVCGVAITLIAVGVAAGVLSPHRATICESADDAFRGIWDDNARNELHSALSTSNLPYAEPLWQSFASKLDRETQAWTLTQAKVCKATHEEGVQSEALLDARMQCLDQKHARITETVRQLKQADASTLENTTNALVVLDEDIAECLRWSPDTAQVNATEVPLRNAFGQIEAQLLLGNFSQGKELAQKTLAAAQQTGNRFVIAEARLWLGIALDFKGDAGAADELAQATWDAEASGNIEVAARAMTRQISLSGPSPQGRLMGERLFWHANALLDRIGGTSRDRAGTYVGLGILLLESADAKEAIVQLRNALDLLGDNEVIPRAHVLNNLGRTYTHTREFPAAIDALKRATSLFVSKLGAEHPLVAICYTNLSATYIDMGDFSQSLRELEKALDIQQRSLAPDAPSLASTYNNMAIAYKNLGEMDEAREAYEKAADILQKHADLKGRAAIVMANLAGLQEAQGDSAAALDTAGKSLALKLEVFGDTHPSVAEGYNAVGSIQASLGNHAAAIAAFKEAVEVFDRTKATPSKSTHYYIGLAESLHALRRDEEARGHLNRAIALAQSDGHQQAFLQRAQKNLAELHDRGKVRERATCAQPRVRSSVPFFMYGVQNSTGSR